MNREILFKAKRLDNGEWVDGFYCCIGPAGQEKHYIIPEYASAFLPGHGSTLFIEGVSFEIVEEVTPA